MSFQVPVRILLLAAVCALLALPAEAQIYAWRDANGNMVLSDRKTGENARTYDVKNSVGFRATRPVVSGSARDRYEPLIQAHASRFSLAPELVRAVIQVESGFNARARSPKGAMGLMQLMPQTARNMGVVDPYDADQNIRGGAGYLRQLLDRYDGNETLALAAYNAGPGAVDKYGQQVPPYQETQNYVRKVGASAKLTTGRTKGKLTIYKTIDIVDGRPVVHYSTEKPLSGSYEVVNR